MSVREPFAINDLISFADPDGDSIQSITIEIDEDSDGLFIKKHVPELKDLDKKEIHDPSLKIREYCEYPPEILDLKSSRLRAIDAFSEAKN